MNRHRQKLLFHPESVSRSLSFYIPATAVARALGLVRGIILARLISEHEFGLFQVTLLAVNVLNPLCGLGLNEGIARYVPLYETRGRLKTYLRRVVPFVAAVALLLSAVVFAAARPLGRAIFETLPEAGAIGVPAETWTTLTRMAAGVTFGTVMYFLVLAILKGMRMFRAVSLFELMNNLLFTILTVTAALVGWDTAAAMMGGYGLTLLIILPLFAIPISRTVVDAPVAVEDQTAAEPPLPADTLEIVGQRMLASVSETEPVSQRGPDEQSGVTDSTSPLDQLMRFSAWAAVAAVIWQVLQYYPMWFLQKTHGPSATAVFGGVRLITQVVLIGAVTIIAVIQTSVNKLWESKGHATADARLLLAYKSTSLLMLIGCVLFALAAGPIMKLFPASFGIGVPVVPLSLMFFLISAHLTFLAVHFALIEKMRHLFLPWTLGLACNVLFAFLLVSRYAPAAQALIGAAWAGVLAMTAALLTAIVLLRREGRPIDAGMITFWIAIYILALPSLPQVGLLVLVLGVSAATRWVFTAEEKHEMVVYVRRSWHQLHSLRSARSKSRGDQP